jgi:hypothetical protein
MKFLKIRQILVLGMALSLLSVGCKKGTGKMEGQKVSSVQHSPSKSDEVASPDKQSVKGACSGIIECISEKLFSSERYRKHVSPFIGRYVSDPVSNISAKINRSWIISSARLKNLYYTIDEKIIKGVSSMSHSAASWLELIHDDANLHLIKNKVLKHKNMQDLTIYLESTKQK